jgi:DHA1 family bicyclomycin/chloramphenicol resistance-like MFS transporter
MGCVLFLFLALFAGGLNYWAFRALPETLPLHKRTAFALTPILRGYREVFGNLKFVMLALALTLGFCAAFTYIIASPAFLTGLLGIKNTDYFVFFGSTTACVLIGTSLSNFLAPRMGKHQIVYIAAAIMTSAVLANLGFHLFHSAALPWSIALVALFFIGSSMAMPNLTLMGIDLFPSKRGTASSCQSFFQSIGNAIATAIIAPLV